MLHLEPRIKTVYTSFPFHRLVLHNNRDTTPQLSDLLRGISVPCAKYKMIQTLESSRIIKRAPANAQNASEGRK